MSQVLRYSFPAGDRLMCDHPVCTELAGYVFESPLQGSGKPKYQFACKEHTGGMSTYDGVRLVKLDVPGEWNVKAGEDNGKKAKEAKATQEYQQEGKEGQED